MSVVHINRIYFTDSANVGNLLGNLFRLLEIYKNIINVVIGIIIKIL